MLCESMNQILKIPVPMNERSILPRGLKVLVVLRRDIVYKTLTIHYFILQGQYKFASLIGKNVKETIIHILFMNFNPFPVYIRRNPQQ